jgi:hypothetical protein
MKSPDYLILLMQCFIVSRCLNFLTRILNSTTDGNPTPQVPFLDEAMVELDKLDGTLKPEFVRVEDGRYTERLVLEPGDIPPAGWIEATCMGDPKPIYIRTEPCDIPKYRTELRWTR